MYLGILGAPPKIGYHMEKGHIIMKNTEKERDTIERKRKEIIDKARKANLADYLMSKGVRLVRNGRRYKDAEHNSLVFTDNMYYWNKKQESGNTVDYLTRYIGFSFNGAIRELTGVDITNEAEVLRYTPGGIKNIVVPKAFSIDDLTLETDMRRSAAYLTKTRHIDGAIIQKLIDIKLLYQQQVSYRAEDGRSVEAHNIVFPIYDEKRQIVGAETAGTLSYSDKRFKGISEGSKYGYGYNIMVSPPIMKTYFFESAIDLISFVELEHRKGNPLSNSLFISMAGLKTAVFEGMIKMFNCEDAEKYLCVDNDEAGRNFTALIKGKCDDVRLLLPDNHQGKDWNEHLRDTKTHNTANLDEWKYKIQTAKKNNMSKIPESSKNRMQTDKIIDISD